MHKSSYRVQALDAFLRESANKCRLDSWNAFVEDLPIPQDLMPALMTGRTELIRAIKPRALNKDECEALFTLLAGLVETNFALRQHAEQTAHLVETWSDAFKQLRSLGLDIKRFANFKQIDDEPEQEAAA